MIDDRYFRPVGMWAGQPFVKRKQRLMTVWEQEQNRTQNWLTPSAKIWPRLNHHLESDVFPLSFPELQIWMKQHKRGPSLKTWEPSQIFTVPIFQPLPLKELNAETCRNQIFLSWRMPGKDMNMAWKCLKHFLWSSFVFSQFFPHLKIQLPPCVSPWGKSPPRPIWVPVINGPGGSGPLAATRCDTRVIAGCSHASARLAQAACPRTHQTSLNIQVLGWLRRLTRSPSSQVRNGWWHVVTLNSS